MNKGAPLLLIVLLLLCQPSYGATHPFEEASPMYVGARALGMGNAFVSVADDVSAGFWNPAGLIQWQGVRIFGMTKIHDRRQYAFDPKGIGYAYRGYALFWGNKIALRTDSGTPDFNYYSLAKQLDSYMALGASLKFKRKHPHPKYQFFGFKSGYDLSLLVKPSQNWKIGAVGRDRNLNFKLDSFSIGAVYQNRELLIPVDLHLDMTQKDVQFSIYMGLQKKLGIFFVRSGISDSWLTGGIGIKLYDRLNIDYALIRETNTTSHFVSAEIKL
jgi:hypothetical protein